MGSRLIDTVAAWSFKQSDVTDSNLHIKYTRDMEGCIEATSIFWSCFPLKSPNRPKTRLAYVFVFWSVGTWCLYGSIKTLWKYCKVFYASSILCKNQNITSVSASALCTDDFTNECTVMCWRWPWSRFCWIMSRLKQPEWSHIHCVAGAEPVILSGDDGEQLGSAAGTVSVRWNDR